MICYKCKQPSLDNRPSHTVCDQIEKLEKRIEKLEREAFRPAIGPVPL